MMFRAQPCDTTLVALRRIIDLPRILDHRNRVDVDVHEPAVALLDAADVDVLHDVTLDRVDLGRTAWAVELRGLDEVDVLETLGFGAESGDCAMDEIGAVPGRDRG